MKKSLLTLFCAILALVFIAPSVQATDYTVEPTTAVKSNTVPMFLNSSSLYGSITQQLFLPSELKDASENTPSAGNITAITFYYAVKDGQTSAPAMTRSIQIWLMEIDDDTDAYTYDNTSAYGSLYKAKFFHNASGKAGTKVYEGNLSTNAITLADGKQSVKLSISPFAWDGESNIVMTIADMTSSSSQIGSDIYNNLRFYITETTDGRFVHWRWTGSATDDRNDWMNNLDRYGDTYSTPTNTAADQAHTHRYVSLTTFTIVTPIPAPTSPTSSDITSSSATIGWTAAAGADSYEVRYGTTSGSLGAATNVGNVTSYALSDLEDGVIYYYQIRTKKGTEYSAWTDEASFNTTAIVHEHNGISFSKWSSTSSLPAEAGNYYLNADVVLTSNYTVPGNINLCLNGHSIYTYAYYITVPDNKTLAVYDNVGGGRIYGYYAVEIDYSNNGLITIAADGTLILNGVSIENLANEFNEGEAAYGIYSVGTLKISGASVISGYDADIYLYDGKVITIEEGKPLTNTTPYRILRGNTGDITSGWTNMNGANPGDYLTSAPPARGVCLNGATGEARYVRRLRIDEDNDNNDISDAIYASQLINVAMTRSLTSSQYNTFCLPFALTDAQLQKYFGAGYDLEEFVSSSLEDDVLNLSFERKYALEAGKPYLLQPSVNVANPSFEGVTIAAISPDDQTSDSYISFHGTFAPTELAGGNKNLLFLGSGNELFWPESTGNIKAFRAYFEVKGAAQKAAKRARIVQKENTTTGVDQVSAKFGESDKLLRNGQLLIIRDNKTYNILGQPVQL